MGASLENIGKIKLYKIRIKNKIKTRRQTDKTQQNTNCEHISWVYLYNAYLLSPGEIATADRLLHGDGPTAEEKAAYSPTLTVEWASDAEREAAEAKCGNSQTCLFDLQTTGNEEAALSTKATDERNTKAKATLGKQGS